MKNTSHLLNLSAAQIAYLPDLVCPTCGAALITNQGRIYTPYPALPGSWTQEYDRYFGYLKFDCECHLNMSSPQIPPWPALSALPGWAMRSSRSILSASTAGPWRDTG